MAAKAESKNAVTYTREALAMSKRYAGRRESVACALDEGHEYTIEDADKKIADFMAHVVKEKVNGKDDK